MPSSKTYLVPIDFSKTSDVALDHAIKVARERKGKLHLLHVISDTALLAPGPEGGAEMMIDYYRILEENAKKGVQRLVRRKRLRPNEYRVFLVRGGDPAQDIARRARRSKAAMIIMGSHGRTGMKRLMLGSVAERTLRYAQCPVLIVKR